MLEYKNFWLAKAWSKKLKARGSLGLKIFWLGSARARKNRLDPPLIANLVNFYENLPIWYFMTNFRQNIAILVISGRVEVRISELSEIRIYSDHFGNRIPMPQIRIPEVPIFSVFLWFLCRLFLKIWKFFQEIFNPCGGYMKKKIKYDFLVKIFFSLFYSIYQNGQEFPFRISH